MIHTRRKAGAALALLARVVRPFDTILALQPLRSQWFPEPAAVGRSGRVAKTNFTDSRHPHSSLPGSDEVLIPHRRDGGFDRSGILLDQFRRHSSAVPASNHKVSTTWRFAYDLYFRQRVQSISGSGPRILPCPWLHS